MARQQRLYKINGAPPTTTGHFRHSWSTVSTQGGGFGFSWIDAEESTYAWPIPPNQRVALYNTAHATDLHRLLKSAKMGPNYNSFRRLASAAISGAFYPLKNYDDVVLATAGLTHYWLLEEPSGNLYDYLGSSHITSPGSAGGIVRAVAGPWTGGLGYRTDGTQQNTGHPETPAIATGTALSVEFWIKTSDSSPSAAIIYWQLDTPLRGLQVYGPGALAVAINAHVQGTGIGSIADGAWRHMVITYDPAVGSNGTAKVYVNGSLLSTLSSWSAAMTNVTAALEIVGYGSWAANTSVQGDISRFATYTTVLDLATVQAHYAARL